MGDIDFNIRSLLKILSVYQLRRIALSIVDFAEYLDACEFKDYKKSGMRVHEIKAVREYFNPLAGFDKNFEIRFNDRDYKVGDVLLIRLWDAENGFIRARVFARLLSMFAILSRERGLLS